MFLKLLARRVELHRFTLRPRYPQTIPSAPVSGVVWFSFLAVLAHAGFSERVTLLCYDYDRQTDLAR